MNRVTKAITAAAVTGVFALSAAAPVSAASFGFSFNSGNRARADRVFDNYCDRKPWDNDCRSYRKGGWDDDDYYRFYNRRHNDLSPIAGVFGFTLGTIFGAAAAKANNNVRAYDNDRGSSWWAHVERCEDEYISYDRRTDKFKGYDGKFHTCRL